MVYELTRDSVKIKTTIFNPPARLINHKELSCAVGMAYKEAGLPMPQAEAGLPMKEFRDACLKAVEGKEGVKETVRTAMEQYIFKPGEKMDEDSLVTLRLGYEGEEP